MKEWWEYGCNGQGNQKGTYPVYKKALPQGGKGNHPKGRRIVSCLICQAPDIGGKENLMSYNLDLMILSASFYEASGHRIDGKAITEMAKSIFGKYRFLRHIINVNRPWQMKLIRSMMYKRYVPYAKLVEEKVSGGQWGNTWRVKVNPKNVDEGVAFDLIGCPLADYARANGYMNLLRYMCATDHLIPEHVHAKLIRTHTCALGSES